MPRATGPDLRGAAHPRSPACPRSPAHSRIRSARASGPCGLPQEGQGRPTPPPETPFPWRWHFTRPADGRLPPNQPGVSPARSARLASRSLPGTPPCSLRPSGATPSWGDLPSPLLRPFLSTSSFSAGLLRWEPASACRQARPVTGLAVCPRGGDASSDPGQAPSAVAPPDAPSPWPLFAASPCSSLTLPLLSGWFG